MSGRCPCLSGQEYAACCGPVHDDPAAARTAEALMRSRFSAFALDLPEHLLRTWHPRTRPASLTLDEGLRWYRLDVLATSAGGPGDAEGVVEFAAHHRRRHADGDGPRGGVLHEVSRFRREGAGTAGRWLYLDALG